MASSMDKLAKELKKQMTASDERKPRPYDTQAEVLRVENGVAWVHIPGGVDETPVRLTINAKKGDNVNLHVANGTAWITGNSTNPPTDDSTANYAVNISNEVKKDVTVLNNIVVEEIEATNARFTNVEADTAKIHDLTADKLHATVGYIEDLTTEEITVQDLTAASGYIKDLETDNITAQDISAATGYIGDLTAGNVTAQNVIADHATVGSLDTKYAHITNGVIDNAKIGYADVDGLNANYAHISNGTIDNAKIDQADVNNLNANYAQINLANVNNAWIENGVVKDAAISDAQILGVSANKLTAGTIDASNITVTNLNASNITTGSITVDGITIDVENNEASIDGSYIEDGTITMNGFSQEVKDVIDGAIETFTGTVVPTLNNAPASSWITTKLKDQHIGDVYYVVNASSQQNGYCYRFTKSGSTYSWQLIKDSDVTAALQRLQTAEGKIGNIESFDEEMATFKTETEGEISTLQTKTTSLETSLGDKVDKTVFNEVKQTVDGNSASITELSTITTNNGLTENTNITNTVNTVGQTATGNSSKISSLTTTLGTNADGTTKAGDIVHRTSAVEQDLSGFKTTVSKTYHKTSDFNTYKAANDTAVAAAKKAGDDAQADLDEYKGTVSETYATKSSLTQTAEGIRTDVSSTYETKTDASAKLTEAKGDATTKANKALTDAKADTTNKLKSYYTKTETDSAITQKAGEISLSVAQTEISKIEVGGRNLLTGTSELQELTTKANQNWFVPTIYKLSAYANTAIADTSNTQISISFDYSITGVDTAFNMTASLRTSTASGGTYGAGVKVAEIPVGDSSGHAVGTRNITSDMRNNAPGAGIMISGSGNANANAVVTISNVKLEFGNKATDWSPAPEDLEAYTDSQVSAAKAEIKVTTDGISTEVAKKTDKETIISTIRQSAESVKIKASQVEIDGTATFNAIKSSTDAAYDAKGAAQSAVDGIEVGGRNILGYTADFSNWRLAGTYTTVSNGELSFNVSGLTSNAFRRVFGWLLPSASELAGKTIVVSAEVYSDDWSTVESDRGDWHRSICLQMQYTDVAKWDKTSSYTGLRYRHGNFGDTSLWDVMPTTMTNGKWHRIVSKPILLPDDFNNDVASGTGAELTIQPMLIRNGQVKFRHLKVEIGNKATDWTPAPEDVQAEIDAKKSVWTLMTSGTGSTYANILNWTMEGRENTSWGINTTATPIDKIKVGDTVRVAYKVTDMGTADNRPYVYVIGEFERSSGSTVYLTMHGLDTTIIDGGNILTNSIGANKIKVSEIKIGAAQITSGTIATARIPDLSAGKITSGTIAVGRLPDDVLNSNIEVGGRNYIRNTGTFDGWTNCGGGTAGTFNGDGTYTFPSTSADGWTEIRPNNNVSYAYVKDCEVVLSAEVKGTNGQEISVMLNPYRSASATGDRTKFNDVYLTVNGGGVSVKTVTADGTWQKVYAIVTINDAFFSSGSGSGDYFGLRAARFNTNHNAYSIRKIKLEKGNKATDWSPAPEDVQSGIDAARTTATSYITDIDSNNGIRIHSSSTENNSVVINAKGMEVFKGGTDDEYSVAKYGDTARIGKESGSHLTLAPDSMSMSDGTKDVFNLLQKTMYIYWTRNYKGRQFANSTDRHVDSWETNTTISTWDSITVNYKLNNTSRKKKLTSISNGVLANDEIYVHFNYSGTIITLTYGRGSSAASSDIIKLESAVVYYVTDEKLSQLHTGTYPNTTVSGALRIGNGTSDSNRRNLMLVDWSGTGKFKGDILAFCGPDSGGGMSLTKAEENIAAFKYEDANGHVYIDAYRVGRIVSLLCSVRKTPSIAPGANLYLLDLTNAHLPKPLGTNTSGTGIYSNNMIIGNIYYNKTVTPNRYEFVCRNGGSTAVSTVSVGFSITYICQMDEVSGEIKYMDD